MSQPDQSVTNFLSHHFSLKLKTRLIPFSLVALLGMGAGFFPIKEANSQTVTPANTARVNLAVNRQPGESFDTLIRRAEAEARGITQRSFSQNSRLAAINVTILGQNEGSIAPLLSLQVNRQNWRSNPNPQQWSTYFKSARSLLRLDNSDLNRTAQTPTNNPVQILPNGTVIVPSNVPVQVVPSTIVPGTALQGVPNGTTGNPNTLQPRSTPAQPTNGTTGTPAGNVGNTGNTGTPAGNIGGPVVPPTTGVNPVITPNGTGIVPSVPNTTGVGPVSNPTTGGTGIVPGTPSTTGVGPISNPTTGGTGVVPGTPSTTGVGPVSNPTTGGTGTIPATPNTTTVPGSGLRQ